MNEQSNMKTSFIDNINDVVLPNALMIGVDYELFWTLNPKSLSPFVKAFALKQTYDDGVAWQHGMYIRMAIGSVMSKGSKYPPKPMMSKDKPKKIGMSADEIKSKVMEQMGKINAKFGKEVK